MLNSAALASLKAWICCDTWHTGHWTDQGRFYDFVNTYSREHGFSVDEPALRELMTREAGIADNPHLQEVAFSYKGLMLKILDFLKQTQR